MHAIEYRNFEKGRSYYRKAYYNSLKLGYLYATYTKHFPTFDKDIIIICQYYSGELSASYVVDLRTLSLYTRLNENDSNPANILFRFCGKMEQNKLERKYCIAAPLALSSYKIGIISAFIKPCCILNGTARGWRR